MSPSHRSAALRMGLTTALVLALVACGSSTPTPSPAGTLGASPTAQGTVTVAGPSPTAPPATSSPSTSVPDPGATIAPSASAAPVVDPVTAADDLSRLGSYRVSLAGLTGEGRFAAQMTVVQRPAIARSIDVTTGTSTRIRVVTVGEKGWIDRTGKGRFQAAQIGLLNGTVSAFEPSTLVSFFEGADYVRVGDEIKNDALTTRYRADATTGVGPGGTSFPPGASIDVWISIDGHLVAFEAVGFPGERGPSDLRIEVTRTNDPANRVTAPV